MLVRKMCSSENKMWIINIGLPVLLFVIAVQCSEPELGREAAFQGRCGHGSPCDQLCYELHDGMYECDCTEGYELNKNGYSCQVINSTYQLGDINSSGTEEDVLYQSDALFSAKLDNSHSHNNNNNLNRSNHKSVSNGDNSPSSVNKLNRNNDRNNNKISREINVKKSTNINNNAKQKQKQNQTNSKHLASIESKSIFKTNKKSVKKPQTNQNNNMHTDPSEPAMEIIKTNDWSKVPTNPVNINDSNDYGYDNDDVNFDSDSDDAELDENDEDYNGDKQIGSESIVIKFGTNEKPATQSPIHKDNLNATESIVPSNDNSYGNKIHATSESNNHSQIQPNLKGQIKSIMDIDDRLNNNISPNTLHHNSKRMKAYEQRNLYVTKNGLSDNAADSSSSIKSYIHIEVYKGNIDDLSTLKPRDRNSSLKTTTVRPSEQHSNSTYDSTTKISLATKPELCLLDCGPDGLCEKNGDVMRCLCPFGKSGNKCENVAESVSVPRFSKHSWIAFSALRGAYKHVQLHIEFKPETNNGIILLTGERDDLTGDFLAVLIDQGYIEFWFDCGSGTGKVRSNTAVILNQWNTLTVYRYRWDAWIQLNNGQRIQGRSKGLFSRITFREPVFLGGTGNITGLSKRLTVTTGMTGCVRKFVANEHEYVLSTVPSGDVLHGFDIQECATDRCGRYPCRHGGKCLPSDQGAICLCPLGYGGDLCEMRLDLQVPLFNGSSYLRFVPLGDSALIWLELKIIVKPQSKYGIILYSGHHEYGDYISLSLNNGYVEFAFELGSGPAVVRSEFPLNIEQWHTIRISRTARLAVMKIDQLSEVMTISPNGFWHLSLPHSLYIGGSDNIQYLPLNLKELGSFIGCIQKLEINGRSMSIISEAVGGTNVDNCPHACTMKPCGVLAQCVPNLESYECQCNPSSLQCNQAEELSVQQNHPTTSAPTTFVNTLAGNDLSKDKITTIAKTERPINGDNNANGSDTDTDSDDDYYYDDYQTTNSDDIIGVSAQITKAQQSKMIATITTAKSTSIPATTLDMTSTSFRTDASTNESSDDDDLIVTKVFGRYMTVDTDKLLKKEKMMKNKKLKSGKFTKKHYLPMPLLEPQSPSLIDDEVEVDVVLPTVKSGNHTTTKIILTTLTTQNPNGNDDSGDNDDNDNINAKDPMTSSEFDAMGFYSNEDVLTTKELIDDMARIMKNGAEIRRNQMNHKMKYLRKSHGACFTGADSYFHYNDAETMKQIISYKIDLNLRFKTHSSNGLILWSGRHTAQDDDDYLLLGIENGYLHFRYNLGSGEVNIVYNSTKVSDGLWHRIRILRNLQDGSIEVDSGKAVSKRSPGKLRQLNTDTGLYVGGMPDIMYYTSRRYYSGIIGCISEIVLGGELKLSLDSETLGTAHNVEPGYF